MIKKLAVGAGLALAVSSAHAVFVPPAGPLFIKFNNVEQISPSNSIVSPSGASEGNWGVFVVTTIQRGGPIPPSQEFASLGAPVFVDSLAEQITGIFYG